MTTFTPNKNYTLQVTGTNVNTWGIPNNANFSSIDLNLGGRLDITASGSDINVTTSQAQNLYHYITGTLTASIHYNLPALGGLYIINNNTTGAYTITAGVVGAVGQMQIPQGQTATIFVNPDTLELTGNICTNFTGGTTTGSSNTQLVTVTPATYALAYGNIVWATASYTNSGAMTLQVSGPASTTALAVQKIGSSGPTALTGGEVVANSPYGFFCTGSDYLLINAGGALLAANNLSDVASASAALSNIFPSGIIVPYAGSTAPAGWLLCYGQLVSTTTYPNLYAAIGTTYGSSSGNFGIPDLRGTIPAGVDNMGGSAAGRITNSGGDSGIAGTVLGASGGSQFLTSHTHTANVTDPGHTHPISPADALVLYDSGNANPGSSEVHAFGPLSILSATTGITVSNSDDGAGSSQNVQPTIMLNYIIKT